MWYVVNRWTSPGRLLIDRTACKIMKENHVWLSSWVKATAWYHADDSLEPKFHMHNNISCLQNFDADFNKFCVTIGETIFN